jgi:hypothetical protein
MKSYQGLQDETLDSEPATHSPRNGEVDEGVGDSTDFYPTDNLRTSELLSSDRGSKRDQIIIIDANRKDKQDDIVEAMEDGSTSQQQDSPDFFEERRQVAIEVEEKFEIKDEEETCKSLAFCIY